jgi:hypothetical protein
MALRGMKKALSERRQHPRFETLTTATILSIDGRPVVNCQVVDWSRGGARLRHGDPDDCPDHFTLMTQDGQCMACQVRWRRDDHVGVTFLKALDVDKGRAIFKRAAPNGEL